MLYYVSRADASATIWKFIVSKGWSRVPFLRPLSYERLFNLRRAPRGHYIFTDFDRLSAYEIQVAAGIARALKQADPQIEIYNHPGRALERLPLLTRLFAEGINSFQATRIDAGQKPAAYPVFIRCEDDCKLPDTGLLHNEAEFDDALVKLSEAGIPLKRRIAVEYRAAVSEDGYFRKYGALRIGGRVFLQHILRNEDWYVKHGMVKSDAAMAREFIELFDNYEWHRSQLERVFNLAGIDYGRADYGIVDGRIEVYEINTNPTLGGDGRRKPGGRPLDREKQLRSLPAFLDGFRAMSPPLAPGRPVAFELPQPQFQRFAKVDWMSRGREIYYWSRAMWSRIRPPTQATTGTAAPEQSIAGSNRIVAPSRKVENV